jgi:hypothetical protein
VTIVAYGAVLNRVLRRFSASQWPRIDREARTAELGYVVAAHPSSAEACPIVPSEPTTLTCMVPCTLGSDPSVPTCPSHADGTTKYQLLNFILTWSRNITNSLVFGGNPVGDTNSPGLNSSSERGHAHG